MRKIARSRLYAAWYSCISGGFVLLAVYRYLLGERLWLLWLRFAIAAGFAALAVITLKEK